jgi:hypothetical protein
MKKILEFIRLSNLGAYEKITWFKSKDGSKSVTSEPYKPTPMEMQLLFASQHHEIKPM